MEVDLDYYQIGNELADGEGLAEILNIVGEEFYERYANEYQQETLRYTARGLHAPGLKFLYELLEKSCVNIISKDLLPPDEKVNQIVMHVDDISIIEGNTLFFVDKWGRLVRSERCCEVSMCIIKDKNMMVNLTNYEDDSCNIWAKKLGFPDFEGLKKHIDEKFGMPFQRGILIEW